MLWLKILVVCLSLVAGFGSPVGAAENGMYPSRPITIIVPFAEGGGLDVAVRLLAKYAAPELGQPIEVANRTSGGNIQGNLMAVTAAPDGYTIGAWGPGLVTDEFLVKNATYTYLDVRPVCMFANDPEVIAVGKEFAQENGIAKLEDLFEYARKNPGQVSIGMGGNWTPHDFLRLKMESMGEVKFNRMPFLGGRPALQAVVDGNCSVALPFVSELLALMNTGKILPLAIAYHGRIAELPDVPCTFEEGYPGMIQTIWRVLTVPKGTPDAIVEQLETAFSRALKRPELREEALRAGIHPSFRTAEQLGDFFVQEHSYYYSLTENLGIRVQR